MPIRRYSGHAGVAFVLVHASPGDARQWEPVARVLARQGEVLDVDLPDYGSASEATSTDPDASVAFVRSVVESLGGYSVVLGGVSYGAYVAARVIEQPPEHVIGAVLASGFARLGPAQAATYLQMADAVEAGVLSPLELARLGSSLLLGPATSPPGIRADVESSLAALSPERLARALRRSAACAEPGRQVRRLGLPVTLLHGRQDGAVPLAFSEELASLGPARLEVLATASHLLPLTHPGVCVRALLEAARAHTWLTSASALV